jgi:hypothetical protein
MTAPLPYTAPVSIEALFDDKWDLRVTRLALDVLLANPPLRLDEPRTTAALQDLHQRLCDHEMTELADTGAIRSYLIIRPINPAQPPPPGDMQRITDAVRTLAQLGMLAGRGDTG